MRLDKYMRKIKKAMTLMEIIIVVVIVGILCMAGVVGYRRTVLGARNREAQSMLKLIAHAVDVRRLETNTYVGSACANTAVCNATLRLNLPTPAAADATWIYSVSQVTATSFCAQAAPGAAVPALERRWFRLRRNVTTGLDESNLTPLPAGAC